MVIEAALVSGKRSPAPAWATYHQDALNSLNLESKNLLRELSVPSF